MLTNDQITEKVEGAFAPLRCIAQIWDYENKLKFKVFDGENNGIVEMSSIILRNVPDEKHLDDVLQQVTLAVCARGFRLT